MLGHIYAIVLLSSIIIPFVNAASVLTDIHGNTIPFGSLKGKLVLINYWASWCQPCLDEIAELNEFYHAKKQSIALFAVNYDFISIKEQLKLIKELHIDYPSLLEDPGPQLGLEHVRGVPATFVFDRNGHLSATLYGQQTITSLNKILAKANTVRY